MSKLEDEKTRLMDEVLNKKRSYEENKSEEVNLTLDAPVGEKKPSTTESILKTADAAMSSLSKVLLKQKQDLEDMAKKLSEQPSSSNNNISTSNDIDIDQLEKDLQKDYGVDELKVEENKQEAVKDFDSGKVFQEIEEEVNQKIVGQQEAVKKTCVAFRRPFVMGEQEGGIKNVMLIHGPHGTGKHETVNAITEALKQRNIFTSSEVYTIDMSRYTSASQEQIFLQDLYEALNGEGEVICFENFESSFASFLRMVNSLATKGTVVLNKRYVLQKGILVEAQTGLVKDAVDSLSANGKYLVFITSGKVSGVQDSFGADFMKHVLDDITFNALDDTSLKQIIDLEAQSFIEKCQAKLKVNPVISDEVKTWVSTHSDKSQGADSIRSLFNDFYITLTQFVLNENLGNSEDVNLVMKDDVPYATINDKEQQISRQTNSSKEIEEVNQELDEIVGLDTVKNYIRSLQAHIQVQQKRKQQGMKTASVSMHMIFTGNPGTGKTTIARLLARYLKAIGVLSEGQLVEVTRADLVAQYVGQTAPLTMSVIKSAIGGVLFIDEAYSLYRGKDDSFGLEAIDTLVKAMEDHRDDLIVVLAGYKKEMATFLEANSGLKSRFPNIINFEDYTGEQLEKIAAIQAKSKGYEIVDEAIQPLTEYFAKVQSINAAEAGNGRLARNVIEEAILKQSQRIQDSTDQKEMTTLKLEDFDLEVKVKPKEEEKQPTLNDLMDMMNQSK